MLIKSVNHEEGKLTIEVAFDTEEIMEMVFDKVSWQLNEEVKSNLIKLLAEDIAKEHGQEITKKIMEETDWPNLLRSTLIKKSIKNIQDGY